MRSIRPLIFLKRFLLLLIAVIALFSCRKELDKISTSEWKPGVALPFIQAGFELEDIIGSDTNLLTNPDSSYLYVYKRDSAILMPIDSIYTPPESVSGEHNFPIGEITFDEFLVSSDYLLSDLTPYIDENSADSLLASNGSMAVFPAMYLEQPFSLNMDPIQDFVSLNVSEGTLELRVENNLPVSLENIEMEVLDFENGSLLSDFEIDYIGAEESHTEIIHLSNREISNIFEINVLGLGSPGSAPDSVMINLDDGLFFELSAVDVKVVAGEGKLQEQVVVSDTSIIILDPDGGEQLYHIDAGEGAVFSSLSTDLMVDIEVRISLPSALIDGEIPLRDVFIGKGTTAEDNWEVTNILLDLTTVEETPYNRIPVVYEVTLLPSETTIVFDSSYKINTGIELKDLDLDFADGNLGMQNLELGNGTLDFNFSFLDQLQGEIILDDPKLFLEYTNTFGIPIKLLPLITGVNTETGDEQTLNVEFVTIEAPDQQGEEVSGAFLFDKENSALVELLAIRPDRLEYELSGITNWNGQDYNFLSSSSGITIDARLEVPLVLSSESLFFADTLVIEMPENYPDMREGYLLAKVNNGFPFDMKIRLNLPERETGEILETIEFSIVDSAPVDDEGIVTEPSFSESMAPVSETFFRNMERADKAILLVEAVTFNNGTVPVVLQTDYNMTIAIGFDLAMKP